jgi:hypothetical protein
MLWVILGLALFLVATASFGPPGRPAAAHAQTTAKDGLIDPEEDSSQFIQRGLCVPTRPDEIGCGDDASRRFQ